MCWNAALWNNILDMALASTQKLQTASTSFSLVSDLNTAAVAFDALTVAGENLDCNAPLAIKKAPYDITLKNGHVLRVADDQQVLRASDRDKNLHVWTAASDLSANQWLVEHVLVDTDLSTKVTPQSNKKWAYRYVQIASVAAVTNAQAAVDAVQTLNFSGVPTTGTFVLSILGANLRTTYSTSALAYNISNANLKTAIEALLLAAGWGTGTVTMSNGPCPADTTVTFDGGDFAGVDIPLMSIAATGFDGGATVAMVETTEGLPAEATTMYAIIGTDKPGGVIFVGGYGMRAY